MTTEKMTQIMTKMQAGDVQGATAELKGTLAAEADNASCLRRESEVVMKLRHSRMCRVVLRVLSVTMPFVGLADIVTPSATFAEWRVSKHGAGIVKGLSSSGGFPEVIYYCGFVLLVFLFVICYRRKAKRCDALCVTAALSAVAMCVAHHMHEPLVATLMCLLLAVVLCVMLFVLTIVWFSRFVRGLDIAADWRRCVCCVVLLVGLGASHFESYRKLSYVMMAYWGRGGSRLQDDDLVEPTEEDKAGYAVYLEEKSRVNWRQSHCGRCGTGLLYNLGRFCPKCEPGRLSSCRKCGMRLSPSQHGRSDCCLECDGRRFRKEPIGGNSNVIVE